MRVFQDNYQDECIYIAEAEYEKPTSRHKLHTLNFYENKDIRTMFVVSVSKPRVQTVRMDWTA